MGRLTKLTCLFFYKKRYANPKRERNAVSINYSPSGDLIELGSEVWVVSALGV